LTEISFVDCVPPAIVTSEEHNGRGQANVWHCDHIEWLLHKIGSRFDVFTKLSFPVDDEFLSFTEWSPNIEALLEQRAAESPSDDFLQQLCSRCNQSSVKNPNRTLVPHPMFADRQLVSSGPPHDV
jgi:hypothetical protein